MTAVPARRRSARRLASLLALASLSTALWLTVAGPTFACSCVGPQPMAAYATADTAVFSGTAGPSDARGVPVRVSQWFSGPGAAAIVYLAASSFGDSAGCGTNAPPAGTEWIWVTFLPEGGGDPLSGLCSPHAQLGTAEGDAMLADAATTFGGAVPPGVEPTNAPEAAPSPAVVPADAALPIAILTFGLGLFVLVAVLVVANARRRAGD